MKPRVNREELERFERGVELVTQPEIARTVTFVCSPTFDSVTRRVVTLDNGRSIPVFPKLNLPTGVEA